MVPIEALLRSSGQYGRAVPVPEGADAQARLLGFIGRDVSQGRARSAPRPLSWGVGLTA